MNRYNKNDMLHIICRYKILQPVYKLCKTSFILVSNRSIEGIDRADNQ